MVDHEVAEILAEIKRRVTNAQEKTLVETSGVVENRASHISHGPPPAGVNGFAGLSVMARAWDRLPPVVSNRTGTLARLELWLKERFRTAFRWFTWEQVNFNSATYQTLVEVVESLNSYEQHLTQLKTTVQAQVEELSALATKIDQMDPQAAQVNARLEGLSQLAKDQQAETQARLAELRAESHLRNEQLIDEHRVCYKQLSLELSESRVLEDRARRELEARIASLETEK